MSIEQEATRMFHEPRSEIARLKAENAALREQLLQKMPQLDPEYAVVKARMDRAAEVLDRLSVENAILQMELDASCNAEELRQVRAENAALRERLHQIAEKMTAHIVANAALREDKARLDWLDYRSISRLDRVMVHCEHNRHISIREAIDAARKEAQP